MTEWVFLLPFACAEARPRHWSESPLPLWEALLLALRTHRISAHACPDLLPTLVETRQLVVLAEAGGEGGEKVKKG